MAGSAEWVAGLAVNLAFFPIFGRALRARAKNRKKCLKNVGGISAKIAAGNSAKIRRSENGLENYLVNSDAMV